MKESARAHERSALLSGREDGSLLARAEVPAALRLPQWRAAAAWPARPRRRALPSRAGVDQLARDALAALVSFFVVAVFCISFASSAFATPEALRAHVGMGAGIQMCVLGVAISGAVSLAGSAAPYNVPSPDLFYVPFLVDIATRLDAEMGAAPADAAAAALSLIHI